VKKISEERGERVRIEGVSYKVVVCVGTNGDI